MESLFHGDARIPRTLRALVFQPGRITQAWARGERRGWMAPFQLFLFLNVIFFLAQSAAGISVGTVAQLTPSFEHQEKINAKLLVVVMVPAFALMLRLAFPLRRRLGAIHVVFALHFYAYLMISLALLFLVASVPAALLMRRFGASMGNSIGDVLSLIDIAIVAIYLWPAAIRILGDLARYLSAEVRASSSNHCWNMTI